MDIKQAIVSCRLRAQAEAVALNLPQELANDVYDGIVADDIQNWTKEEYISWCKLIELKYNLNWSEWKDLYISVSQIMSEFGSKLTNGRV